MDFGAMATQAKKKGYATKKDELMKLDGKSLV